MDKEIKRVIELLGTLDPLTSAYRDLIFVLGDMVRINEGLTFGQRTGSPFHPIDPTAEPKPKKKAPKKEEPAPVVEPTPVAEPIPAPVVEEEPSFPAEEPASNAPSKEDVRAALSALSGKGIQIKPIIAHYVPEGKPVKFAEIPASLYPEIMEEINNAG